MKRQASAILAVGLLLLGAPVAPVFAQSAPYAERVDVTAIELMVDVRDAKGKVPEGLKPEDFVVLEDKKPQRVIAVDYVRDVLAKGVPAEPDPSGKAAPLARPAAPWQLLIYFDLGFTTPRGVKDAAQLLSVAAERLTALGPVEVAVAEHNSPRQRLRPTRDPALLRSALAVVAALPVRALTDIDLVRRSYLGSGLTEAPPPDFPVSQELIDQAIAGGQAVAALSTAHAEIALIRKHRDELVAYTGRYDDRSPKALLLVTNGFQPDPAPYYMRDVPDPYYKASLATELRELDLSPSYDRALQDLAARHWTFFSVATDYLQAVSGERDMMGKFSGDFTLGQPMASTVTPAQPLDILRRAAQLTGGGLLVQPEAVTAAVESLGNRVRVTYQLARKPDDEIHNVQVRVKRSGLTVVAGTKERTGASLDLAAARARKLLIDNGERGELPSQCFVRDVQSASHGNRFATLTVRMNASPMGDYRKQLSSATLRYSIAVADVNGEPFLRQDKVNAVDLATRVGFEYDVPLTFKPGASRVAVVVEETSSGAWGSCTAELAAETKPVVP
jgi:VWFA-related protein